VKKTKRELEEELARVKQDLELSARVSAISGQECLKQKQRADVLLSEAARNARRIFELEAKLQAANERMAVMSREISVSPIRLRDEAERILDYVGRNDHATYDLSPLEFATHILIQTRNRTFFAAYEIAKHYGADMAANAILSKEDVV